MWLHPGSGGERKAPRQHYSCPSEGPELVWGSLHTHPPPQELCTQPGLQGSTALCQHLPIHTPVLDLTLKEALLSLRLFPPPLPPVTCTLLPSLSQGCRFKPVIKIQAEKLRKKKKKSSNKFPCFISIPRHPALPLLLGPAAGCWCGGEGPWGREREALGSGTFCT